MEGSLIDTMGYNRYEFEGLVPLLCKSSVDNQKQKQLQVFYDDRPGASRSQWANFFGDDPKYFPAPRFLLLKHKRNVIVQLV